MQAPKYTRNYDFTVNDGDQTNHAKINAELDNSALSINQLRTNQMLIQKDDGTLKDKIVTAANLAADAFQAVTQESISASASARASAAIAEKAAAEAKATRQTNSKILPASTVDPTTRPDGSALEYGDIYLNTSVNELRVYKVSGWAVFNETDSYAISETYNKSEVYNKTETLSKSEINDAIAAYSYAKSNVYTKSEVDSRLPKANSTTGLWDISVSGNAATTSKLKTAIKIGGVTFDGSSDIDLPGVNKPSTYALDKDQVLAAIAKGTAGSIGTYAFLYTPKDVAAGATIAGSQTYYSGLTSAGHPSADKQPSGTWQACGFGTPQGASLFLRVS